MRKKQSADLMGRVLDWMKSDNGWRWCETCIDRCEWPQFSVYNDGSVLVHGLGTLPFDWSQRRSIARAFKRVHGRMTAELIEAGKQALKAKAQAQGQMRAVS